MSFYLSCGKILTFYIDLYLAINKQRFIEIYAGAISAGISGGFKQIVKKLKGYLPGIIPKMVMDGQTAPYFNKRQLCCMGNTGFFVFLKMKHTFRIIRDQLSEEFLAEH